MEVGFSPCRDAAITPTSYRAAPGLYRRVFTLLTLAGLAVAAAGCGAWPMFRSDATHTGRSAFSTASLTGKLKWKFSFPAGCNIVSSPSVGPNDTIYIGAICTSGKSVTGAFCAINFNGKPAWCTINLQGYPMSSSAAIGGAIYVGGFDSGIPSLLAIDPSSGTPIWNFPEPVYLSPPTTQVAISANGRELTTTIYVGSTKGFLYAINGDGTPQWFLQLGTSTMNTPVVTSSPAVAPDGTVYVGLSSPPLSSPDLAPAGGLEAVTSIGAMKWLFNSGSVDASPAVAGDGTIYFGSHDEFFYSVNPGGTANWALANLGEIVSSAALAPGDSVVYFGSENDRFYAVDPSASVKWTYLTGGPIYSSPAVGADGTIFVGSDDRYLYALTPAGKLKWKYLTGGKVRSSPAIGMGGTTIYVGSSDGSLYAIK
jgi:outer membrane protein assembly factor BamB